MSKIVDIQPVEVWRIFDQMLKIPRPSGHEEKIREWAVQFGKNLGLPTTIDEAGNVIIKKPATPGMENRKGVVLQGHLDMVPQKNSDKEHDFTVDPITAFVDGDWVTADGTTLGADNGIGVAAILAVIESTTIKHGPLEALLTATEETGMDGALGLASGKLDGEILINTDSEDEGELYVGCAGGEDVNFSVNYSEEPFPSDYCAFDLRVTGFKGGHSGIDIILQRGNAIQTFFRILYAAQQKFGARLVKIEGGSLRNAIPREAFGVVAVDKEMADDFRELVKKLTGVVIAELMAVETSIKIEAVPVDNPLYVMDKGSQEKLAAAVMAVPNGVIRMSDGIPGLVETSSNLAFVKSSDDDKKIIGGCLLRSSVDTAKTHLANRIKALFELAGADVSFSGSYPGWKPNLDSGILKTMQKIYNEMYGKTPEVKAIHAGLECGILGAKYPHWDMISFGPTIRYPHSPDEKVHIEAVSRFWDFLRKTVENIPVAD